MRGEICDVNEELLPFTNSRRPESGGLTARIRRGCEISMVFCFWVWVVVGKARLMGGVDFRGSWDPRDEADSGQIWYNFRSRLRQNG